MYYNRYKLTKALKQLDYMYFFFVHFDAYVSDQWSTFLQQIFTCDMWRTHFKPCMFIASFAATGNAVFTSVYLYLLWYLFMQCFISLTLMRYFQPYSGRFASLFDQNAETELRTPRLRCLPLPIIPIFMFFLIEGIIIQILNMLHAINSRIIAL